MKITLKTDVAETAELYEKPFQSFVLTDLIYLTLSVFCPSSL